MSFWDVKCDVYRILKPDAAQWLARSAMLFRGFKDVGVRAHVYVCLRMCVHLCVVTCACVKVYIRGCSVCICM